ncbi:MAG: methyltransferase, partial [Streptomyces sp.]|uniref:methyltransferase family protein n=1 Tax=Streptomyces sp. TaxID=1931 RepID=UPI0025D8C16F
MTDTNTAAGPAAVLGQAMAFQSAKLVLTGMELGLFEALAKEPGDEEELRRRLGLHARGTGHFLAALAELGFLERGESGRYRNSDITGQCLVPGAEGYLGGFLRAADQVMYPAWGRLSEALRTGAPQAATYSGEDMFGELYDSEEKKDGLVGMAEDASRPLIPALTQGFDWAAHQSVLELGGCRGNVLAGLAR